MGGQANILFGTGAGSGGGSLPGVTDPFFDFTVGDSQAGTPANGSTVFTVAIFAGQSLVNKRMLPIREGIALNYNTPVQANGDVRRYNSGGLGGFTLLNGLQFQTGDRWQIYIIGIDNTIEV